MGTGCRLAFFAAVFIVTSVYRAGAQATIEKEQPMAKDAGAAFLVATVKPSAPDETREGFPGDGRHLSCLNETVDTILTVAYGIHVKQIVDAPEWLGKEHYDIDGVIDGTGDPSLEQEQQIWRRLLADRFHLVFHRETRQMPIYAVTVAKGGSMLKAAEPNEMTSTGNGGGGGQRILKFRNMSMSGFTLNMNWYVDRPVVDQTSLPGYYDFSLKWTYDDSKPHDPDAAPSLFTAVKEQLGLRMDAVKGPAEVLVIEHVERPSAN